MEIFRNIILVLGVIFFGGLIFGTIPYLVYTEYGIGGVGICGIFYFFIFAFMWAIEGI